MPDINDIWDDDEDAKMTRGISNERDSGFLWFLETSYGYITPRGFLEHVSFLVKFPSAWLGFRKSMKTNTQ